MTIQPTCGDRAREFFTSKPVTIPSTVVAVVIAILGGLALAGVFLPSSPLGGLGDFFGKTASVAMLGIGTVSAIFLIAILACRRSYTPGSSQDIDELIKEQVEKQVQRQVGAPETKPEGKTGEHSNVNFD